MSDGPFIDPGDMPREGYYVDADAADVLPPLDLGALTFGDVPTGDDFTTPDASASREPRRSRFGRGKRTEKEPPTRARATRAKAVPKTRPGALVEPIEQIYTTIGALLTPLDPVCGTAVIASANRCAETLDKLAQQNDAVRRALLALTQTSAIGAVAIAHAPIIMAVATHHVPAVASLQADIGTRVAEAFANSESSEEGEQTQ